MHTTVRKAVLLTTALVTMACTTFLVGPLVESRQKYELTSQPVEGVSPELVLASQIFGWARGIMIDVIWIRMERLQRDGRYFELAQLSDWSCKLAPRIPQAWDIQSWNMAYNVSCTVTYFPDRWTWVWSGFELLRDKGVPNNPNAYELYERMAWILFHKVAGDDDNAHYFYKERFALMMQEVFGGTGTRSDLLMLDVAPRSREELLQDKNVRKLAEECAKYEEFDIIGDFFKWYHTTDLYSDKVREVLELTDEVKTVPPELNDVLQLNRLILQAPDAGTEEALKVTRELRGKLAEIVEGPGETAVRFNAALEAILDARVGIFDIERRDKMKALLAIEYYARSKKLREQFAMDPRKMLRVVDIFRRPDLPSPPIDWRSPFPHAIYWALAGLDRLEAAKRRRTQMEEEFRIGAAIKHHKDGIAITEDETIFDYPRITLQRMVYFSMQDLVKGGRLLYDANAGLLHEVGPEYRLADSVLPVFQRMLLSAQQVANSQRNEYSTRSLRGVWEAYKYFLERGIREFYFIGDVAKSEEYFALFKRDFPGYFKRYQDAYGDEELTYDTYIAWQTSDYEAYMPFQTSRNTLRSLYLRAWYYFGLYADDISVRFEKRAARFKEEYDKEEQEKLPRGILDDKKIRESALIDILAGVIPYPRNVRGNLLVRLKKQFDKIMEAAIRAQGEGGLVRDLEDIIRQHMTEDQLPPVGTEP